MEIVVKIEPFVKQLNESKHLFDLNKLCQDIARKSSLQVKAGVLALNCELHAEQILGPRWNRNKSKSDHSFYCVKCKQQVTPDKIKRNGHYHKGLQFDEGYGKIKVPLLVHNENKCLGVIQINWPFLEKRKRFWFDVIFNVTGYYFEGIGLRGIKRILDVRQSSSIGIMSVWRMIQRVGNTLRSCCPSPNLDRALKIKMIGLDEIFMRLRIFRGKGKKALKQTIYGLAIKALGKNMPLLSFGVSSKKDEETWFKEIDAIYERGINKKSGLQIAISDGSEAIASAVKSGLPEVPFQQCTFHVQKDLLKLLRDKYGRKSKRVKRIIAKVNSIFRSKSKKAAEAKLNKLSSLSKFAFEFLKAKKDSIFTYYLHSSETKDASSCNTNNCTERENREIKRRLIPMLSFKSPGGAENFGAIMLRKEFYRIQNKPWLENLFSELSTNPKPIKKPPPDTSPSLSAKEVNKLVGIKKRFNKNINYDLPIIRTSNNFALDRMKPWIEGYSILDN